jgi:hypothetical protein
MASLKEAAAVVEQLEELAGQLHAEVMEGRMDFRDIARLADQIGESADAIAGAFTAIDEAITEGLVEPRGEPVDRERTRQRGTRGTRARGKKAKTEASTPKGSAGREKTVDSASGAPTSAKQERDDASSPLEELSKEDLLERAGKLDIDGRSTMSKEELVAAVQSEEQVSKEELLDRAKDAGISGRSSMSKEELAEAVRSEESLSREELLERARDADIPGRFDMSKDELRQALSSQ